MLIVQQKNTQQILHGAGCVMLSKKRKPAQLRLCRPKIQRPLPVPLILPLSAQLPLPQQGQPGRKKKCARRMEALPLQPWLLPAVGNCIYCGARRFYSEVPTFTLLFSCFFVYSAHH